MPRNYKQKNPFYKNARISVNDTVYMVHCFLRGLKASDAGKEVGVSEVTAHKIFGKLRKMVSSIEFNRTFSEILEEQEYMLWTLYQAMRAFLINIDISFDPELDELLEDDPDEYKMLYGAGHYRVTFKQLWSCVYFCDTETPPLVIQKMANDGKLEDAIQKRLSCKNCPLRLLEFYKPSGNRDKWIKNEDAPFVIEPYYKYKEDERDLMILWVEILHYLSSYRNLSISDLMDYSMQAMISRMLKRSECKVKNIHYGMEVKPIFLEDEQKAEVEKGFQYQSLLEALVLEAAMGYLEKYPL